MLTPLSIPSFGARIHHMSVLELLFALLLVCVLAAVGGVAALVWSIGQRSQGHVRELAELRTQIERGDTAQDSKAAEMRERLAQTQATVEGLRSAIAARQTLEEDARASLKRLENVIAGSSTRGAAGEKILEEVLKHLPTEMLQRNAWVGGKVVELGLRLPGGTTLDAPRRAQLTAQVEREVERRVREVSQYINPEATSPFALAVIPDAA